MPGLEESELEKSLVVSKTTALKHVEQLVELLRCQTDFEKDQVSNHLKKIHEIFEQGQDIGVLAKCLPNSPPRALALHYPTMEPIFIDYRDSLGAALFGQRFMTGLERFMSSKPYKAIALPLSTLGGVCFIASLFPGLEKLGIVSFVSAPVYLLVSLFIQRKLFFELITGFDQVFLLWNMLALSVSFCTLFGWDSFRTGAFLLFIPTASIPALFADATSYKMKRNARVNYFMGCMGYMFLALALLTGWFDIDRDILLFPDSLRISLIQRSVSFCTNMAIFYLRFAIVTVLRARGDLVNIRSLITSKRIVTAPGQKTDLLVLTPTQAAEVLQLIHKLYQLFHSNGRPKAQVRVHILEGILSLELADKNVSKLSKQKVAPATTEQASSVNAKRARGTQVILVSIRKPYVIDTSHTLGKVVLGEIRMRRLAYLNRQPWFMVFLAIGTMSGAASVILVQLPGCEMFALVAIISLPTFLTGLSFMHIDTLRKLFISFDQVFLFGNILVYSALIGLLVEYHPLRFLATVILLPLFSFVGVFSDALPSRMRVNSICIYPLSTCVFIFAALMIQLDIIDIVEEPVTLFPNSLNISVKQRCLSFALNASFFYLKLSLRLVTTPKALTTLKGSVRPVYVPNLS